jgi:succinate dehydrogenase flavin-adding protein (antitoxin of CptAB toxin-antitoxin module)
MMHDNITRIVNSKVYEKGNGLIFELDRGIREVKFIKEHVNTFEKEMKDFVRSEYRKILHMKDTKIDMCKKQAFDMIN